MARNEHTEPGTVTARLQEHARTMPGRVAYTFLRDNGQAADIHYDELARRVAGLAVDLAARAVPGSRALLLYPAGLDFIVAFFACLQAGVIAVPAPLPHPTRAPRRLQALVADAAPVLVLTCSDCATLVNASLPGLPCVATDTQALPDAVDPASLAPIDPAMTAFLQYTSGSTAQPKGVEVTHGNLASNAEAIRVAFGFTPASVMASWLPLFHDMGLIGTVVAPLYAGLHAVLMAPAAFLRDPALWLRAITRYRATCAGAPDFGWDLCARKIRATDMPGLDLSTLAVAFNGAEPVRAATLRTFVNTFAGCGMRATAWFPCYGMAEATLFIAGGPAGQAPRVRSISKSLLEANQVRPAVPGSGDARDVVSAGVVAAGHQVMVVDPESLRPAGRQRVGEIWVAGPSVARGYWQNLAATQDTFGHALPGLPVPFLRTGDLGFMDDGELFITGRLKDLVIIHGRNVYPQDVEAVIETAIDFIGPNQCAAFAVDVDGHERLAIVAEANRHVLRAVRAGRLDDIAARAHAVCALVGQQFDVAVASLVFVKPGTFPRTTSGKVQRARCRELALAGKLDVVYAMPGSLPPTAAPEHTASRARADAMIAWLRQYAARRLQSRVADARRTVAPHLVLDLGNQGFFGLQVPAASGGAGLATTDLLRVMEQLAAVDLTLATIVGVHNGLGVRTLLNAGSAAMRARLLPHLAGGRQLAAFALTEPAAGSNPAAMRATAVQVPGGWRVNAEKQWIGLAAWAGVITVFARAFDTAGQPLGTIALLVAEDTPGLVQGPEALTMGMRGMVQNTIFLDDAFVPDAAVLGAPGAGMDVARDAMQFSRLGIAAMCVGGMKRCAQLMTRYAERRDIASGRLLDHPVTLARLHDLGAAIAATAALVRAIATQIDAGDIVPAEAYLACKTAATELFSQAADSLVQLLGGRGYIETNAAPQILRDARVLRILEGPTETLYGHLGAALQLPGNGVVAFIGATLQAPALTAELAALVARCKAAPGFAGWQQWRDYRLGELAAAAFLLAAAPGSSTSWARRRFDALARAIETDLAGEPAWPAATALRAMVSAYSADIGDIDQAAPGDHQHPDPLLRRAAPAASVPVAPPPGPASTDVETIVQDVVTAWLRSDPRSARQDVGLDTPFTALGMDSLATVALAVDLEHRTGLTMAPELLYDYQTVRTLAACLAQRLAPVTAA